MLTQSSGNRNSFSRVRRLQRRFRLEDTAQDMIEYAMIAAMMALMCSVALSPVAQALNNVVTKTGKKFKEHVDHGLHKGWYK